MKLPNIKDNGVIYSHNVPLGAEQMDLVVTSSSVWCDTEVGLSII